MELDGTEFQGWILRNNSAVVIFLGDADVLTTTRLPIDVGAYFSPGEIAHGQVSPNIKDFKLGSIAGSASNDVRILVPGRPRP